MPVTFLPKAVASSLTYYLSRLPDSGSTVSCVLYGPGGSIYQASATATQYTRTTVSSTSTAGGTTLVLTSGSNVLVGERYIVTNAAGQSEEITVDGVSSNTVTSRQTIQNVYASTNVFASRRVTLSVAASSLQTAKKNCRARWTYTSGSLVYTEDQFFHVSSYCPVNTVTEGEILRRLPLARNFVDPDQPLSELINDIFSNDVLSDLSALWSAESIISGDSLKVATVARVMSQLALNGGKLEVYEKWIEEYKAAMDRVVATGARDSDDDGSTEDETITSVHVTRIVRG